ncbi:hypothetical protein [Ideonella sp.]|jgi:hypothetical protein|uniref:hypothetical protein n=1 Tax=Ideonella sp. TaxID=1929293 RepID=UPI0035AD92E9
MLTSATLLCAGCASTPPAPRPDEGAPPNEAAARAVAVGDAAVGDGAAAPRAAAAEQAVTRAVTSPLADLNLMQTSVPPVLQAARRAPYAPVPPGCDGLAQEVLALDDALGPDLDRPSTEADPSLLERGAQELGGAAAGALKSAAEGLIPFRSWVRKLTGAERHSREVAAAIAAGAVRRAYLKGLGQARHCAPPAAPLPAALPASATPSTPRS